MSNAIIEAVGSRRGRVSIDNPEIELLYKVKQTEDDAFVRLMVESTIPFLYNLTTSLGVQVLQFQDYTHDHLGNGIWDVAARYGKKEQKSSSQPDPANRSTFSFDTTGGTQHITQSLETIARYPTDFDVLTNPGVLRPPPNFQGAIGVNSDAVEGCDVVAPAYAFTETHYVPKAFVTGAYKAKIYLLTGKVNDATFTRADGQSFARGTCQFLGATGSSKGTEDWEITYRFTASPSVTGITIGDIPNVDKEGFHYLWVRYSEGTDANQLVKRPSAVYVERVLEYAAFGDLGIGE